MTSLAIRGQDRGQLLPPSALIPTPPPYRKSQELVAMVVVGSQSTDPQKFTKDYCGLFTGSGLMPKRHLAR